VVSGSKTVVSAGEGSARFSGGVERLSAGRDLVGGGLGRGGLHALRGRLVDLRRLLDRGSDLDGGRRLGLDGDRLGALVDPRRLRVRDPQGRRGRAVAEGQRLENLTSAEGQ
jgi:hypothetical protein